MMYIHDLRQLSFYRIFGFCIILGKITRMITITATGNGIIKQVKKLYSHAGREKSGETVLEGERLVWDSVKYGAKLRTVLLREGYSGRVPECEHIYAVSASVFDNLAETETPQGILAIASMQQLCNADVFRGGLVIVCDRIQDPGNLGTIFRLAHAADADGVVLLRGTVDAYSPKVMRASMGSVFALPSVRADRLPEREGYTAFCGALTDTTKSLYDAEFPKATMLILGNEGEGVSKDILSTSQHLMIPMPGGTESLNVAVAGSVMVYEYYRQVHHVR